MTIAYYFTAPWCAPCRTLGPVMAQVTAVPVEKVDVDETPELATEFGVMSIPTVVLVKDGYELRRFSGARDKTFVDNFITA